MPLLPAELFFYSFPGEIECPNPECANSLTWRKDKSGEYAPLIEQIPSSLRQTVVMLPSHPKVDGVDTASSQSSSVVVNPGGAPSDSD